VNASIRALVADDHPPTRAGVRTALERGGITVCAEARDAASAVAAALEERPDVCLLDIRMPGGGIAAAAEIRSKLPDTAVVMLTVSEEESDLFDSLRAGAAGYLLKNADPERLVRTLEAVVAGEAAIPRRLVARVIEEFYAREGRRRVLKLNGRRAELTTREWEVLELLRGGLSTAAIAERLFVSSPTVRSHVAAILRKIGARDRAEAVRLIDNR
jgi:DNA-binding NarL/FixJ family response regulator